MLISFIFILIKAIIINLTIIVFLLLINILYQIRIYQIIIKRTFFIRKIHYFSLFSFRLIKY